MESNQFKITEDGVFAMNDKITQFSISQFKLDHSNFKDIRPITDIELMRYCCAIKPEQVIKRYVLFKDTSSYIWEFCKLDTSLVSKDSLGLDKKMNLINQKRFIRNKLSLSNYEIPFHIEKGYVYQIFGLPDLKGSFYFCINKSNKLIVQYFDAGPF